MRFVLNRIVFLFVKDVSDLWYSYYFLFLAVGKLWNQQEDKASVVRPITINSTVGMKELDEQTDKVEKLEDAIDMIKKYEEILQTKRKGIIAVTFHQGKGF